MADTEAVELASLLRSRRNQDFDGECHLTNEEADRLIAALTRAPPIDVEAVARECERCAARARDPWGPDPEDPFWMLEVRQGFDGAGSWLKNDQTYLTTREPIKALRYPSRWAADCARSRLPLCETGRFEPTEHSWISAESVAAMCAHKEKS